MTEREWESLSWLRMRELLFRAERIQRSFQEISLAMQTAGLLNIPEAQLPLNIVETATAIVITAAVPGAKEAEIDARLEGGEIVLSWQRALPKLPAGCSVRRLEIPSGRVERRLALPIEAVLEDIELQDGLLRITLIRSSRILGGKK